MSVSSYTANYGGSLLMAALGQPNANNAVYAGYVSISSSGLSTSSSSPSTFANGGSISVNGGVAPVPALGIN